MTTNFWSVSTGVLSPFCCRTKHGGTQMQSSFILRICLYIFRMIQFLCGYRIRGTSTDMYGLCLCLNGMTMHGLCLCLNGMTYRCMCICGYYSCAGAYSTPLLQSFLSFVASITLVSREVDVVVVWTSMGTEKKKKTVPTRSIVVGEFVLYVSENI